MSKQPWNVRRVSGGGGLFAMDEHQLTLVPAPAPAPDPLDKMVDGWPLRQLLHMDERARHGENVISRESRRAFTPAQREAVSAHWSAQLRAKVAASDAAAKSRDRNQVVLEADPEDFPW